ncbi:site-2 protease family protein [Actinoplanes sp. NPDC024001]|uniref:site-2 protease family protein n=1 Tax=Actinoplanes sp. NPDC024001 TaxID=3154598 RepID=UPI0033F30C5B
MRQTIRLGTIRGIPVGVHWSVLLILLLLTDGLAMSLLPTLAEGYPAGAYWLTAAWVAALFLTALVTHELAHAVTAQHFGIRVESITLWALGGVSTLDGRPRHPRAELLIALAGPAASLLAAGLFAAASIPAGLIGSDLPRTGLAWLAGANLVLAVFNLLPGAPLDGGRVLAAILWWLRKDRAAARHAAARAGGLLGIVLMGLGAVLVFGYAAIGGFWLVLLGWYLSYAARAEEAAADLAEYLDGIPVSEAMSAPAVCGYAGHTVSEFIARPARLCPHRAYPVTDIDGRLAGVVTIAQLTAIPQRRRMTTRIAEVMVPASQVRVTGADTPLLDVIGALNNRLRTVVVVEQDRPCGVLTTGDVTRLAGVAQLGGLPTGRHGVGPAS